MAKKNRTFLEVDLLARELFSSAMATIRPQRILWADAGAAATTVTYLRRQGFLIQVVNDAAEALTFIRHKFPDSCLLDVDLIPFSGLEILEALREDPMYQTTKVWLTSNHEAATLDFELKLGKIFGAVGFLPKPLTAAAMMSAFKNLFDYGGNGISS